MSTFDTHARHARTAISLSLFLSTTTEPNPPSYGKSMKIHARTDDRPGELARDFVSTTDTYIPRMDMRYPRAVSHETNRRSYVAKSRRTSRCGRSSRGNSRRDSIRNLWKALGKLSLRGFRSKTVFGSRVRIHTCIKCKFEPCQSLLL